MPDEDGVPRPRPAKWVPVEMASLVEKRRIGEGAAPEVERRDSRSAPGPDLEIGRVIKGKYRIVEQIGAGGMAVVYRAEEQGLIRRDVAIKLLKPGADLSQAMLTRFLKEAQAIAAIDHPNVVRLFDIDRTPEGQIYLVMERLVGKPLQQVIREMQEAGETFTWEQLAPLMIQACRALHAAHKQNIIHRDIKPGNCFCCNLDDDEWHLKILDFGIAKARANSGASVDSMETPLTQDGMFIGTPHYAAPEVIRQMPDQVIDGKADIFALGVMMYQCMTGTLPFHGAHQDKLTILYRTMHERAQPPRERAPERNIPLQVDALIMRAIEAEPGKRFASVAELAESIRATLRSGSDFSGARNVAAFEQTPRPPGEFVASLSIPAAPVPTPNWSLESTPGRPMPTGSHAVPAAGAGPDQSTPKPPGEPLGSVSAPTVLQQVPARTSTGVKVVIGGMSVGLLVLLLLFLYEVSGSPSPTTSGGTSVTPVKPVSPRAPSRPVESPPRAPAKNAAADGTAPASGVPATTSTPSSAAPKPGSPLPPDATQPSSAPMPEAVVDSPAGGNEEPGEATPRPKQGSAPDPQEGRRRDIKAQLKKMMDSRAMDKCLPLHLGFGDGVHDELPVKVQVDAKGAAKATVWEHKVKHRLPKSSDACIFKIIQAQQFPAGGDTVVVTQMLRFD